MTDKNIDKNAMKDKLIQLEQRKKEVKRQRKISMGDYKDQLREIDNEIDEILKEFEEK